MNYRNKIESLLKLLPHKLSVSFALICAESVFEYVRAEDKEVVRNCLDMIKLWLEDKATIDEVETAYTAAVYTALAADDAAYAVLAAANAAINAPASAYSATYSTANATHSVYFAAYYAAHVAHLISFNKDSKYYYNLLLKMIKENTSPLDRILLNIDLTFEEI